MKLKKNLLLRSKRQYFVKFSNICPSSLKKGDYIGLSFMVSDRKKQITKNVSQYFKYNSELFLDLVKLNYIVAILLKKKLKKNNYTIVVSTLYINELVKWRVMVTGPQFRSLVFIQKCLNMRNLSKIIK